MRRRQRKPRSVPGMMLSPMIDMMFLLLVFFIVGTMYMSEVRTLPVRLPDAEHTDVVSRSPFHVTIAEDGSLYLEGEPIGMKELLTNAARENQRNDTFSVILRADEHVEYQKVVQVMDGLRGVGVYRFGLAAEPGSAS